MKRTTSRWTTAVAATALLGLPAIGRAQATSPAPQPSATAAAAPADQAAGAQAELREAKAAVDSIDPTAVTGRAKTQIAELKRHLSALEKAGTGGTGANAKWATDVAAIDKILTSLTGGVTTGASAPAPTGTSGIASKAADAITIDEATRGKLADVRTHVTAFAAAMSGAPVSPKPEEPGTAPQPSASSQPGTAAQPAASSQPATAAPPAAPSTAAAAPAPSTVPQANPDPAAAAAPAAQPQVDTEAARRSLMDARNSLTDLTQLPAASQLAGDARVQVSQLISNFNELITAQANWKASFDKVNANLTTLIGPDASDPAKNPAAAPTTPGAVGTSGATSAVAATIDPAIKAKLVELRTHLQAFEKAAGGATTNTVPGQPDQSGEASRHIEAIEATLTASAAATGTTGSASPSPAATAQAVATSVTLDQSKVDQIRLHLSELRKLTNTSSAPR